MDVNESPPRNGQLHDAWKPTAEKEKTAVKKDLVEEEDRDHWTNPLDFFLSCLGYAVGLGNVWRFPYLCYRNGGGAFLIPYVIMLASCGLPIFFMELALGQYHGKGPNIVFKHLSPVFNGLGYAMIIINIYVGIYYNMIIAWTIFYLFASFTSRLGWELCGNWWNSPGCFNVDQNEECLKSDQIWWNNTCSSIDNFCQKLNASAVNTTHCEMNGTLISANSANRVTPSEDYYLNYMLGISSVMEDFGILRWQLVLCLLASWIIVCLCLIKGVKSSGKVVYFTALFPYVVLIILLIRGATLEGASNGVYFYIVPSFEKLLKPQVWGDAAVQIFYSLGPGFGSLLTLSSYNRFNNNCYRDAIIIALSNCGTSVFAGFVIFSILGFMAHTLDLPVDQVVKSGAGLAFIAYPEAVTKMPLSPLWSILFFFMLITLGLDSQFAMCETIITAVYDQFPKLAKKRFLFVICVCFIFFILGLPLCTQAGVYYFTLLDNYSAGWSLLMISLCEIVVVSWVYGLDRFNANVADMIGHEPNRYWTICWKYISPITITGILLFTWINYTPASFGDYVLPPWANLLGWLTAISSVIVIPIFGAHKLYITHKNGEELSSALHPTEKWGPRKETSSIALETIEMPSYNANRLSNGEHSNEAYVEEEKK